MCCVFCVESLVEKCANGSPVDPVLDFSSDVDVDAATLAATPAALHALILHGNCNSPNVGELQTAAAGATAKEGRWN